MQEDLGNIAPEPDDKKEEKLTVPIVPVEELIPDIKPRAEVDNSSREKEASNHFTDVFSEQLIKFSDRINLELEANLSRENDNEWLENLGYRDNDGKEISSFGQFFKDKVVVDLCAGQTAYGYIFATVHGAKGYVGVEKYDADSLRQNLNNIGETIKKIDTDAHTRMHVPKGFKLIPAAVVGEDILSFLEKLPDDSVSFLSSGTANLFTDLGNRYGKLCNEQMSRTLSGNGLIVANESVLTGENTEVLFNGAEIIIARKKKNSKRS